MLVHTCYGKLFQSMGKLVRRINRAIEILFYGLFFLVPLAMHPKTNELFEFNKMWVVFYFSLLIFFLWTTKMILLKRIEIRRTPFDIPLLLFLLSQIISTIFSIDHHTSFWGYYTRFNGGLLSTISYIFLYYAFASNFLKRDKDDENNISYKMLFASFLSGIAVALWGLPSHFGKDPTCLVFRGTFDVSCWTDAFQPKIRMFSTLGQPNWLAAFLAILLFVSTSYAIIAAKSLNAATSIKKLSEKIFTKDFLLLSFYVLTSMLFYADICWTLSQSGFIGFWGGNILFTIIFTILVLRKNNFSIPKSLRQKSLQTLLLINVLFLVVTFFAGNPIPRFQKYTFSSLRTNASAPVAKPTSPTASTPTPAAPAGPALETNITGSNEIRLIVWQGAIEIFKKNPLFGSGVETYAFAYYKNRPIAHNLVSEWDFLYNKAHNEFLNYLATTGLFGFGTYMLFIAYFLFYSAKNVYKNFKSGTIGSPLPLALTGAFISIMISNFFGFSVVIVNLLFFLIPLFWYAIDKSATQKVKYFTLPRNESEDSYSSTLSTGQLMSITASGIFVLYCLIFLINYWYADKAYALGYNYNHVDEYVAANQYLEQAVKMRGGEDLYKNELSTNLATLTMLLAQQGQGTQAAQLGQRAKQLSDEVVAKNPNNVVYFKARTRVLFSLAQLQPSLLPDALEAINKAQALAPTDAKILYNKALLLDQQGKREEAIAVLDETIRIKSNYRDAYYAQALFLSQMADDIKATDPTKSEEYKQKAIKVLNYSLSHVVSPDTQSSDLLKSLNP